MTKQPIVILHGWGSSPDRWRDFKDALIKNKVGSSGDIYIPSLPGFGNNTIKTAYTIDSYVAWLMRYLKEHNINNPTIIGHSHGGRIAIRCAATSKNINKLVLISAAGLPNNKKAAKKSVFKQLARFGKTILLPLENTRLYFFAQKLLYKLARESDYINASPVMRLTMQNVLKYDATNDLKKISCPCLCVWGEDDTATPLWMGREMAKQIPNATLFTINGGHNIYRTHLDEVVSHITKFFSP